MGILRLRGLEIRRGIILHSNRFDNIDHGKLFVIMGEDDENCYGFFFINSQINRYIERRKDLFDMQFPLKRLDYPDILVYDSFLDCHELTYMPKKKLLDEFGKGTIQLRGILSDSDIETILEAVRESRLFSDYEKETVFK